MSEKKFDWSNYDKAMKICDKCKYRGCIKSQDKFLKPEDTKECFIKRREKITVDKEKLKIYLKCIQCSNCPVRYKCHNKEYIELSCEDTLITELQKE